MAKPYYLSAKAIVTDTACRCLAIRRSQASKNNAGLWDLPGGKGDPGETVDAALRREALEETGLEIEILRVLAAAEAEMPDRKIAYMLFEALATNPTVRLSEEHDQFQWLPPADFAKLSFVPQFQPIIQQFAAPQRPC